MSRKAPLACFHCQASHSFSDSLRRLAPGCSAINWRIEVTSSAVITRPRYLHSEPSAVSMPESKTERKCFCCDFFQALTRRHTGGASASGLPAASSNCA